MKNDRNIISLSDWRRRKNLRLLSFKDLIEESDQLINEINKDNKIDLDLSKKSEFILEEFQKRARESNPKTSSLIAKIKNNLSDKISFLYDN